MWPKNGYKSFERPWYFFFNQSFQVNNRSLCGGGKRLNVKQDIFLAKSAQPNQYMQCCPAFYSRPLLTYVWLYILNVNSLNTFDVYTLYKPICSHEGWYKGFKMPWAYFQEQIWGFCFIAIGKILVNIIKGKLAFFLQKQIKSIHGFLELGKPTFGMHCN